MIALRALSERLGTPKALPVPGDPGDPRPSPNRRRTPHGTPPGAAVRQGRPSRPAAAASSPAAPGAHSITASYDGDAGHAPSTTAVPSPVTVGFSRPCITTPRHAALNVAAGEAVCITSGGSQTGPVTVAPGGSLAVSDARITGPVSVSGALALDVCGTRVSGPFTVTGSTGGVLIGSPDPAEACAGNTFAGPLTLTGNSGGLQASANSITGPVRIDDNSGALEGPARAQAAPAFRANRVTGPLRCEGNLPALVHTGTAVLGPRSGQCREER